MIEYDVIVAGAGPAGAQFARNLAANSKYSVLVLDRTQEIGEPKKSTAGTFKETMVQFDLPKKIVQCKIDKMIFEGPTQSTEIPVDGFVLEFGRLKKFLIEEAVHHGAELKIGATVTKPILEGGKITGIEYNDLDGIHTAKAKIVVDATGPGAVLATQLGLRNPSAKAHWVGLEFEMERVKLKHQNAMLFKFDHTYAPGGYSWIFSTGKNHGKVGTGWQSELFKKMGGTGSQLSYLKKWMKVDERLKMGQAVEMHAGDAFIEMVKKISTDNFMCVGDAVCTIDPLLDEGIRWGMYTGTFAAKAAIAALKKGDTSAGMLSVYDKQWNSLGISRRLAHLMTNRLYSFSNKSFDKIVINLRKLDDAAVKRFIDYKFTLRDMAKILPI